MSLEGASLGIVAIVTGGIAAAWQQVLWVSDTAAKVCEELRHVPPSSHDCGRDPDGYFINGLLLGVLLVLVVLWLVRIPAT